MKTLGLLLLTFAMTLPVSAQNIWTENSGDAPSLVAIQNFSPVIDKVDIAIVNVSGSSDPKQDQKQKPNKRERGPQQGPVDPFMNPEEFFERFFGGPGQDRAPQPRKVLGSGFIISKDGYILTNNHVVEGVDKIEITLLGSDKQNKKELKHPATVVGRDPATDIALLKIKTGFDLPMVALGDSSKIAKGDWALAFGNPFGLDHSVSAGIISAVGREISPNENRRFDDFIQTDAAINFGNSGGPLVNLKGEAIGINTAITAQGSGIGFAVPINLVKDIVRQLKDSGSVSRGYLGVLIQDVTEDMKDALGLSSAKGVLVNDVVKDGPAEKGNLRRGDIILKVNGEEVNDAKTLQRSIAKIKPGSEAKLDALRDKKPIQLKVKLGNLSDSGQPSEKSKGGSEPESADKLGITVGPDAESQGVQIRDIEPGSAAEEAGLQPGDQIRQVNKEEVKSVTDYKKIVDKLKSKSTVLFDLERGNSKLFIAFRIP